MKVGDRVVLDGKYHGEIISINFYRPPEEVYAIDLDEYKADYIFCSSKRLRGERMTEQEKCEKAIYAQYRDEINQMYDDIVNSGCPISADNFKVCHYVRDAGYRKEEEVKKETEDEIFSRLYEEIRENYRKDSVLTRQELLEFIQHVEFQMLKEEKK